MSAPTNGLERDCVQRLRRHVADGGEPTLHSAYELGRSALAADVGVLELGATLFRSACRILPGGAQPAGTRITASVESFVVEALSPYEMALRGAREANRALHQLEDVREAEVQRLSRELHDSAGQLLAGVHLALDELSLHLDPAGRDGLNRAQVLLVRVEEQLRRLAHELRPSVLDDLGLVPALELLAEGVSRRAGIRIAVRGGAVGRLPGRIETALYRIAQEALHNVVKHARARDAVLGVALVGDQVQCTIEDDGVGPPRARARVRNRSEGLGLRGMRERAAALGGVVDIQSAEPHGMRIDVRIPLEVNHAVASADRG